jgi:uroporphyrinogen decarboxylase
MLEQEGVLPMYTMTSSERFKCMFAHEEADRVAMWDFPWPSTLRRWRAEGMPESVSFEDYFGMDKVSRIEVDNSPRYPQYTVEETGEFITQTTSWGGRQRVFRQEDSTPDFIDYTITDRDRWLEAKSRMTPTDDRIPWEHLKKNYGAWREAGHWILGDLWFSFNHFTSYVVGMERFLIYMLEDPELCSDMLNHSLDVNLALLDRAWDAGYTFDMLNIRDDMGYKHSPFFSLKLYREIVKPSHVKAVEWAHKKGIVARLHSCGYIAPFLPEIVETGFDALHPMEVKAGMDPLDVKRRFGNDIVIHGGFDARLWEDRDAILCEIRRLLPELMQRGGCIFAADHSIPNTVSLETMRQVVRLVKEIGCY